jgi:hypothetical protein
LASVPASSARRTITSTDIPRLASALPYQVPVNGMAWRGSRATATRIRHPETAPLKCHNRMVFGAKPVAWSETEGNDQFCNFWRHAFLLNRTDNHSGNFHLLSS